MKIFPFRAEGAKPDLGMADSYRNMMSFGAWKHLERVMEKIKADAINEVDSCPIENLSVGIVAHSKGMREAILKLEREIQLALNGGANAL